jgi:hypothetical protein
MPHLIPKEAIQHLATLRGVTDFDDWKRQLDGADERIDALLQGPVADAWRSCFPIWLALGRVNDFSRAIHTPKYWPTFANHLGHAFAEVYQDQYGFLVNLLSEMPVESSEYLCAYDLLEMIVSGNSSLRIPVPDELFAIDLPVPPVVTAELQHDARYSRETNVGNLFRRMCQNEFSDEDE